VGCVFIAILIRRLHFVPTLEIFNSIFASEDKRWLDDSFFKLRGLHVACGIGFVLGML
jgi:hypothetical protein